MVILGILRAVTSHMGSGTNLLMFLLLEPLSQGDLSWLLQLVPLSDIPPAPNVPLEPKASLQPVGGEMNGFPLSPC